MKRWLDIFLLGAVLLQPVGCASIPAPAQRLLNVEQQAVAYDWRRLDIEAAPFVFAAYLPRQTHPTNAGAGKVLTIYIEGDGLAWVTASRPSSDPTPVDPVGLALAFSHPDVRVAYLARPCQYTMKENGPVCEQKYWTTHRFAPEVVASTSHAIDVLKKEAGAATIRLVGYSGGGAVAALVAAGRKDVRTLVTVAGNLDHAMWTKRHFISPLDGSLNPADVAAKISSLPQLHFVGRKDRVIPRAIAESFLARLGRENCAALVEVAGASHGDGWVDAWPALLQTPFPCGEGEKTSIAIQP